MDKNEEFMSFLNHLAMMNQSREESDAHMAKFFYAKYETFIKAGFSEDQAFQLLLTIVGAVGNSMKR